MPAVRLMNTCTQLHPRETTNNIRCHTLFSPFTGENQASILCAHPACDDRSKEDVQKLRKNESTKFSKRRKTLLRKAHDLHKDCGVDIYLVVRNRRNNQIWQYSNGYVPPLVSEFVSVFENYKEKRANTI